MSPPKGVFCVKGRYWYHQEGRDKPKDQRGPLTRLPEPNTPEWFAKLAEITGTHGFHPASSPKTMRDLVDAYKARKWPSLQPASKELYQSALNTILAAWGRLEPRQISIRGILALQEQFVDRPSMGNQLMVQVRALMKLAVQLEMRSDNPAREIDLLKEEPDGAKPLTNAAWLVLTSESAPDAVKRFAILGRATGQRIGDLVVMTPSSRQDEGIVIDITKTRKRAHWCPLSPNEVSKIDGWKQWPNTPFVGMNRKKRHTEGTIRRAWNALAESDAGEALRGFTPHDLRATKVCDDRIAGYNHGQISARVGMSINMVIRYSRHIDQKLAAKSTKTEREPENKANS